MSRNPASSLLCGAAGTQEAAHWAPVFDATMISPGQTVCGTMRPSTCNLIWSTDWGGRQAGPTSGREGVVSLGRDQVSLDATQDTQDTLPLDGAPRRRAVGAADVVGRQCAADVVAVFRVLAVFRVEIPARRQDADVAYGPGPAGRVNSPPQHCDDGRTESLGLWAAAPRPARGDAPFTQQSSHGLLEVGAAVGDNVPSGMISHASGQTLSFALSPQLCGLSTSPQRVSSAKQSSPAAGERACDGAHDPGAPVGWKAHAACCPAAHTR